MSFMLINLKNKSIEANDYSQVEYKSKPQYTGTKWSEMFTSKKEEKKDLNVRPKIIKLLEKT